MAPRHQRGEQSRRVPRLTLGPQVGGEVVAFFHAREGRRRGGFAETPGAVGGDGQGGAAQDFLEDGRDGGDGGVGFEKCRVAVAGGGAF